MNKNQPSILQSTYYYIPPIIVSIITIIIYSPSWDYAFQFDDVANIQKHFNLRHYTFFDLFFSGSRWISYWLNTIHYSIGKLDPFSYRVGNSIIHTSNGFLVFLIIWFALSRIKKNSFFYCHSFSLALITCTLFLLHPVQTQTVSYVIQGELEGLATLCSLTTIFMFLLYAQAQKTISRILLIIGMYFVAFFSCGTKEITIVLPFLLVITDWWFIAQGSWTNLKQRVWLHVSMFGLIISTYLYLLKPQFFYELFGLNMTIKNNIGNVLTHNPSTLITPGAFFISQFKVILHYLWIFMWPFAISVEYDWKLSKHFFATDCIVPFFILLSIGLYIAHILKKNSIHPLCFGAVWFALCIAPRSTIIPSSELIADYKTYLASVGWLFILAIALLKAPFVLSRLHQGFVAQGSSMKSGSLLSSRSRRIEESKHKRGLSFDELRTNGPYLYDLKIYSCLLLILTMSLGYCTIQRNTVWRSGLEFWADIIKNAPGKARAYNNYGVELVRDPTKFEQAIPYFQKAIAMDNNYSDPCNNLAVIYARNKNTAAAIETFKRSLQINPYQPEGYNNLASLFLEKKEYDKAKQVLQHALKIRPHYGKAFFNLGRVYTAEGDHVAAWEYYKKCCMEGDMDNESGFNIYAQTSADLKKFDDAIFAFKKVLEFNPHNFPAIFKLANACYHTANFTDALHWYNVALQKQPQDNRIIFNIGETYIKLNEFQKAAEYFKKLRHMIHEWPQIGTRLIDCYNSLGDEAKAQKLLAYIATLQNNSITIKSTNNQILS